MYSFSNLFAKKTVGYESRSFEIDSKQFANVQKALGADDSDSPFVRKEMNEFILTFKKNKGAWTVNIKSK